jgi:hypothetical protein
MANTFPVSFVTASGRDLKDMCVSHEISDSRARGTREDALEPFRDKFPRSLRSLSA